MWNFFLFIYSNGWLSYMEASTGPFLWQSNFLPFPAFTQIYRGDVHKYLLKNLFYMGSKTLEAKFVIFFLPLFIQVTNLTLNDVIVKITNEEEMSHKGKKFRSYPLKIKTRSCQVCWNSWQQSSRTKICCWWKENSWMAKKFFKNSQFDEHDKGTIKEVTRWCSN